MEPNAKIAAVPIAVAAPSPTAAGGDFQQGRSAQAEQAARYRLIIEEGPTRGTFVYKTLDSSTGQVVRQFPREQLLALSQTEAYSAGVLIDTSA